MEWASVARICRVRHSSANTWLQKRAPRIWNRWKRYALVSMFPGNAHVFETSCHARGLKLHIRIEFSQTDARKYGMPLSLIHLVAPVPNTILFFARLVSLVVWANMGVQTKTTSISWECFTLCSFLLLHQRGAGFQKSGGLCLAAKLLGGHDHVLARLAGSKDHGGVPRRYWNFFVETRPPLRIPSSITTPLWSRASPRRKTPAYKLIQRLQDHRSVAMRMT